AVAHGRWAGMCHDMPDGSSRVTELSGDCAEGQAIAPRPPDSAVVVHREHVLSLRGGESFPVGTFTLTEAAPVGPAYATILPSGGSRLRDHFHEHGVTWPGSRFPISRLNLLPIISSSGGDRVGARQAAIGTRRSFTSAKGIETTTWRPISSIVDAWGLLSRDTRLACVSLH